MNYQLIKDYIDKQPYKVVEIFDIEKKKIKYSSEIKQYREIKNISGDEEVVRAYLLTKLVNELGYKPQNIELEKEYEAGRPKVIKPRIDLVVRKDNQDVFLYMELKAPDEYEKDKDNIIDKQLYSLASIEKGQGHDIKYLSLYTIDIKEDNIRDNSIIIDYGLFSTFDSWKGERNYADEVPAHYGLALKQPFIKGGKKDLEKNYSAAEIDSLRANLHNVLWGGGGTDDNDVFSSLVNIILAKIQDEGEKNEGEKYDFQIFSFAEKGNVFETNNQLFDRINSLYRRALKERMNLLDEDKLKKSYVIDENKFSLAKLKYTISELEKYSFTDGKNSLKGKDILGDFFEGIVRDGFKQNKGQFFTHINIVNLILWGLQLDKLAIERINRDKVIPYLIDPSAGSGTFLIEYMKFITKNIKYRFRNKINKNRDIEDLFSEWFPDQRENRWAKHYIYGIEHNFNLGTASKVNMILHGDGSTNIFVKDGLLPFTYYSKDTEPNALKTNDKDTLYNGKYINGEFDVVISNPPFSVTLDKETQEGLSRSFVYGDKRNSENLFIERYYQLLRPNGRLGIILPESVFDTTENKYIRLFVYKFFKIKAVVSLPQVTFEPYTSTKTSILFAQKKTAKEIELWNNLWHRYSLEWNNLKTRVLNLLDVYIHNKNRNKLTSIKNLSLDEEKELILRMLKNYAELSDSELNIFDLIKKYKEELTDLCRFDKDTESLFGFVNTWWVFGEVSKELNYKVFMSEVDSVGYKRTKRGEKPMPNDLYRLQENDKKELEISVDDNVMETALDYMRNIKWE